MTFNLIDQALTVAMTGLVYGSGIWIICAFGAHIVTRDVKKPVKPPKPSKLISQTAVKKPVSTTASQSAFEIASNGTIEVTVEQSVLSQRVKPVVKPVTMPLEIVCVPVDWTKWRVADLRKASLAKVCGVRTRPIGSRRNLKKADLIAQYEQQLKRFTQVPSQHGFQKEKIA